MFSGDPMQIMNKLQQLGQDPQKIEQMAEALAMNPQMAPPPPGSMQATMEQIMAQAEGLTAQGQVPTPDVSFGAQTPVDLGTSLGNVMDTRPMPDVTAPGASDIPLPEGEDEEEAARRRRSLAALAQLQGPAPQRQPNPPFISNLGFGSAAPAQGLNLQAPPGALISSLGQYL